jgi:hypothetical protein
MVKIANNQNGYNCGHVNHFLGNLYFTQEFLKSIWISSL